MKIGILRPADFVRLARELHAAGAASCAEYEAEGAIMTQDETAREQIDFWLDIFNRHKECCGSPGAHLHPFSV